MYLIEQKNMQLSALGSVTKIIKDLGKGATSFEAVSKACEGLSLSQTKAILTTSALSAEEKAAILASYGLEGAELKEAVAATTSASAHTILKGAVTSLGSAFKGLWATIISNPILIVATAVTAAVSIYSSYQQKLEDIRTAHLEEGQAAKEEAQNITELYNAYISASDAYQKGTGSKDALTSSTESLLSALGLEQSQIESLVSEYGNLDAAINKVTRDALQKDLSKLTSGYAAAREEAAKTVADDANFLYDIVGGNGISWDEDDPLVKYLDELDMLTEAQKKAGKMTWFVSDDLFSDEGYEQAKRMYDDLLSMREVLENNSGYTPAELAESSLYKSINDKIVSFQKAFGEVMDYEDQINSTLTQLSYMDYIDANGLPQTQAQFDALKESVLSAAESNSMYIGSQEQVKDSVVNTLSNIPELSKFFNDYTDSLGQSGDATLDEITRIEHMNKVMDDFANNRQAFYDRFTGTGLNKQERLEDEIATFNTWFDKLSDSDKEHVYTISCETETAEWNLEQWQAALEDARFTFDDLLAEQDTDTEDSFSTKIKDYLDKIEKLKSALDTLEKDGKIEPKALTELIEQFPELAGHTDDLDLAIRDLMDDLKGGEDTVGEFTGIYKVFQDAFGRLETDEDVAKLQEFMDTVLAVGDVVGATEFSLDIDAETNGMEKLFSAIKESVSSTGLSADSLSELKARYQDLEGYDPSRLFEKTTNGIHLNTKALRELESAYEKNVKEQNDLKLDELVREYNRLTNAISETTDQEELANLYKNRQNILDQINDTAELAAQYEGLTSAFHKWEEAQSIGEEGDMYDSLAGSLENIKQLYDDGLVGTNKFRAAVQLMSNEDLSTANIDELIAAYDKGYDSMTRYFQDSSDGCLNFLEDVQKLNSEWAHMNEDGSWQIDFGLGNDQEIADALGINVEAVQSIMRKLSDYGFDINLDSVYSAFDLLESKAEAAAKKLNDLGKTSYQFNFETNDLDNVNEQLENIQTVVDTFKDDSGKINLDIEGAEEAQTVLVTLMSKKQSLCAPEIMQLDMSAISEADAELANALQSLRDFISLSNDLQIQTSLGLDTSETQQKLQTVAQDIQNIPDEVKTKLGIDNSDFEATLQSLQDTKIDVKAGVTLDETQLAAIQAGIDAIKGKDIELLTNKDVIINELNVVDSYQISDKSFKVGINGNPLGILHNINSIVLSDKSFTITTYKRTIESSSKAQGTAHSKGTAFASGNWGTRSGGTALVGELGQELVVRNGKYFTIGDNGAELFQYHKDDIIFNAEQTRQILANGKITNGVKRGVTYAEGTAFSSGSGTIHGKGTVDTKPSSGGGGGSSGGSGSGSSSSEKEEEPQIFDWIEVKIDRIERAISKLKTTAESAFKSLKTRLSATSKEMAKVSREIEVQEKAYKRYMKQADSVELSDDLKEKVQNGTIDINEYDSETQELIKDYQEWYEKALDCDEAVQKLHEDLAQLYKDNFDNIQEKFEHQLNLYDHLSKTYETGIKALEAKGYLASTEYYKALSDVEKKNIKERKKELADLEQAFSEAMASGEIEKGSDAWYEMQEEINKVKEEIDEANVALLEYQKTMREIKWSYFDYVQDRIGQITQETDFLIDLMSSADLFNDNGQLSDKGLATMGLRGENLNVYMAQADAYAEEILKLDKEIAKDPYNTDLVERREEMLKLQQDSIKAAEQEKQAIVDLVEQGIKIELENLKELIDAYTSSLDSAKNLYEYQKKIKSQTSDIAKLQKQLMAYAGDTSEENRARVQKITVDLAEAQEKLAETEYEQFVSETKKLLDELYSEYEEILNERLDNVDVLIEDMIDTINDNSADIAQTLKEVSDEVGYTISDENRAIWSNDGAASAIISKYGDNFSAQFTTVNQILSSIEAKVASMVKESDKEAKEDKKTTTPTTEPTKPDKPGDGLIHIDPPVPKKPEKKKRTDKENYGVALAIINGNYGWGTGETRKKNLEAKGFDYNTVQGIVNKLIKEGYVNSGAWVGRYHGIKDLSPYNIKKFKLGGLVDYTGLAQLDGTPDKPELVLNSKDTENYMRLTEALRRSATTPLTYSGSEYSGYYAKVGHNIGGLDMLSEMADKISKYDNLNTNQNITVTFGDIVIDHVEDYNDFVNQLKEDKQFEKMINAMTTDRLLGGSSFAKNKYRWN